MSDPLVRTTYGGENTPRSWLARICPCGVRDFADSQCAGFPGVWDEDRGDFDRGACLAEFVEVGDTTSLRNAVDGQLRRHLCYTSDDSRQQFWRAVDDALAGDGDGANEKRDPGRSRSW